MTNEPLPPTTCCIAGGGPAGMMLGYLLARSGVRVTVLEKHTDFLRDFRGDTIHPSTLTVLEDLGLLDDFLKLPHQEITELSAEIYGQAVTVADFRHTGAARPFLALVPQWDFLNFLKARAEQLPAFTLHLGAKAINVIENGDRVVGVQVQTEAGVQALHADLVVAADGRHTTLRPNAGLAVEDLGAPIDVLWFRVDRDPAHDRSQTGGYLRVGAMLVTLNRDRYWQCAFVIPKGGFEQVQAAGIEAFRARVAAVAPFLAPALAGLAGWDAVSLLSVQLSRMPRWYRDGLLCIGDAAHAMSPVGGVGINLAVQDAVATANLLVEPLRAHQLSIEHLAAVQQRRAWPARVTQAAQAAIHAEILGPTLAADPAGADQPQPELPLPMRALQRLPLLRRLPARLVGIGVRPERVHTLPQAPQAAPLQSSSP